MKKTFVITTAVPGGKPHFGFYDSLKNYAKLNKATLLVVPSCKIYSKDEVHSSFKNYLLNENKQLNQNLLVSLLPINPESVEPLGGLDRISDLNSGIIYASPKQRLKSVASPKDCLPKVIMTTGAVTRPYSKPTKNGAIANIDHVLGAIIVEVENEKIYHFRQIQADSKGYFIDLCKKYTPKKVTKEPLLALVPGDWHTGFTDPKVRKCVFEIIKNYKPEYVFLHDFFDGISVNPHIRHKLIQRASLGSLNDLKTELVLNAAELKAFDNLVKNVVVVDSNHHDFLSNWLDRGDFMNDERNHIIGLELALNKALGQNPLEYGLRKFETFKNVTFLHSDESFKLTDKLIEFGVHGHRGPNGSRGASGSLERSYGHLMTGHTHAPEILRNKWTVGTSTYLTLQYNVGASSWIQTAGLVYKNGSKQLVNFIMGKYRP